MAVKAGLQETLITAEVAGEIASLEERLIRAKDLSDEAAADLLTRHVADLVRYVLRNAEKVGGSRVPKQLEIANALIAWLRSARTDIEEGETVPEPGRVLESILASHEARVAAIHPPSPLVPLRQSELIVNGPRDVRLGNLIQRELPSADRVDMIVSFLKHTGLRVLVNELRRFCERRPGALRVLTTTYLGATEVEALRLLESMGADIRVSYDARFTRLHAKAWIFHRDTEFSTAVVGSSNLSKSAMLDGREWNVRVSQIDNGVVYKKLAATFDQYWDDGTFEPYDEGRFLDVLDAQHHRDPERDAIAHLFDARPYPHQVAVLDSLAAERAHGYHHNLVVAATGTGKTMVAAFDFRRIRDENDGASLLFVAHREEILRQSLATFRAVLNDGDFGRRFESGRPLDRDQHLFAPIQALHAERLATIRPDAYDVLIVDEFHHAAADSYAALLEHLRPKYLIGLTATPERTDARDILHHFDGRVAAELRLWDALDLGLLCPFQYFGIHDEVDLSQVDFRAGRYDVSALETLYTADHVRARAVLRATRERVRDLRVMRALGFCVSVKHAEFMAEFFSAHGVPSLAVHGGTRSDVRERAAQSLKAREVNVLFTVDLFNEGVDLPTVDTVLFLRPTESATIFLQQLGRGLRVAEDKACLTVLDFIGNANARFRFDRRYGAIVRGTRAEVLEAVKGDFPHLPSGCEIRLDPQSRTTVIDNIQAALKQNKKSLAEDLANTGDVGMRGFLAKADVTLEELYASGGSYTDLLHRANLRVGPTPAPKLLAALQRALHIDDPIRLDAWRAWLARDTALTADREDPLQLVLYAALGFGRERLDRLQEAWDTIWAHADVLHELRAFLDALEDRRKKPTYALPDLPLAVHGTYGRYEVTAALGEVRKDKLLLVQGGVYEHAPSKTELLFVTLDKDEKQFTPTTQYDDYPLSLDRFHWQSQGRTRADSPRGLRYQRHVEMGWRILLFVRRRTRDAGIASPFVCLGPVRYESHEHEKPMSIVWRLERPMPPGFWNAVKIAPG